VQAPPFMNSLTSEHDDQRHGRQERHGQQKQGPWKSARLSLDDPQELRCKGSSQDRLRRRRVRLEELHESLDSGPEPEYRIAAPQDRLADSQHASMGYVSEGQQQTSRKQDDTGDRFLHRIPSFLPFGGTQNRGRSLPRKFSISRFYSSIGGVSFSSNTNYPVPDPTPAIGRLNGAIRVSASSRSIPG
jgi:hypothetical protein